MASSILLYVAAALCTFQVLMASQVNLPQSRVDPQIQNAIPDVDEAEMLLALSDMYNGDLRWFNATEILEMIEEILAAVQQKVQELQRAVEEKVKEALDSIEQAALDQANRWNATIQEWVDKANAAGVDIKECLEKQGSLSAVVEGLRKDARACVDSQAEAVNLAVADVKDLVPEAQKLVADAKEVIKGCVEGSNPVSGAICLTQKVPFLVIRASRLGLDSIILSARVATTIATVGPMASLCASKAAAGRAAEASVIVNSTISCIKGKLGNN